MGNGSIERVPCGGSSSLGGRHRHGSLQLSHDESVLGTNLRALEMAIRFSVVASAALLIVGIAGALLSLTILDTVDELWTTPWGRLLLGKVLLVGIAATAGDIQSLRTDSTP